MPDFLPGTNLGSYELKQRSIVQASSSMFSGSQQVYDLGGKYFELEVDLPPLTKRDASKWKSFFSRLNGQANTFYFNPIAERFPQDELIIDSTELITTIPNSSGSVASGWALATELNFNNPSKGSARFTYDGSNISMVRWPVSLEANAVYCVSGFFKPRTGTSAFFSLARWTSATSTTDGGATVIQSSSFTLPEEGTWQTFYFRASTNALPTAYISLSTGVSGYDNVVDISCMSCKKVNADYTCTYGTFANGSGVNAYGTFTGASATGFTAAHDGTGANDKICSVSIPNFSSSSTSSSAGSNWLYLTFDLTVNSGTGGVLPYLSSSAPGTYNASAGTTVSGTGSKAQYIKNPVNGTNYLIFFISAATNINFTVSNLKLVRLQHTYGVSSATANANSITLGCCPVSHPNLFTAGDYISISNNLYMVTQNVASSITGTATVNVFPCLRSSYAANTAVTGVNPLGTFRLMQNSISHGVVTPDSINGVGFSAREAF